MANNTFAAKFCKPINNYINSIVKNGYYNGSGCSCGNCSGAATNNDIYNAIGLALLERYIAQQNGLQSGVTGFDQLINNTNVGSAQDGRNQFYTIDSNESGKISRTEYENYFMRQKELETGERIDENHPEYKRYKREAKNLFNALKGSDGSISQKRFNKMLQFFDRADGYLDGKIDNNYMQESLTKIKQEGANTDILNGKSLRQLINLEG